MQAISNPMMPPPITSSRLQSAGIFSAPVESKTRGSSGNPGNRTDSEPAAMMHCLKSKRREPSGVRSSSVCGPTNLASPCTTSTLRCLASR